MSYEFSARAPNGFVSRFEESAAAARMRAEEYLAFDYEKVLVRKNGAHVSWPELNFLVSLELETLAPPQSPNDTRLPARSPQRTVGWLDASKR